jgi:hypothetical protein
MSGTLQFLARRCCVASGLLSLQACVAVWQGGTQAVRFTSEPSGAVVEVDGQKGTTPCELLLDRSGFAISLVCRAPGRTAYEGLLSPDVMAWYLFTIPVIVDSALLVPVFVDFGMDAFWDWPREVHVTLPVPGAGRARAERGG